MIVVFLGIVLIGLFAFSIHLMAILAVLLVGLLVLVGVLNLMSFVFKNIWSVLLLVLLVAGFLIFV